MWIFDGDVNEVGDAGKGPGKSFLFSLTNYDSEIGLSGARVRYWVEHNTLVVSGASLTVLENPTERISLTPGRTHNRSRSPR
jgi:hypothetical protein